MMILMIDNYDSFTYNIVQYFGELQQDITSPFVVMMRLALSK